MVGRDSRLTAYRSTRPRDLFELLEISPSASSEVVRAAYHALVRAWHPDVNSSTEAAERIRELNAAYEVLRDPQRRARYELEQARARRRERLLASSEAVLKERPTRALVAPSRRTAPTDAPSPRFSTIQLVAVAVAVAVSIALILAALVLLLSTVMGDDDMALSTTPAPIVEVRSN